MNRTLYVAGWGYVALCAAVLFGHAPRAGRVGGVEAVELGAGPHELSASGYPWFVSIRPSCNALEVEIRHQQRPPPATTEGVGYSAACFALAGKIERARAVIDDLPASERTTAAAIVFNIGHPVADAGDDESAGPIMELVLRYQPDNYMALYHAGMSAFALGRSETARTHLREFLRLYSANDGWRSNALEVLGRLDRDAPQS